MPGGSGLVVEQLLWEGKGRFLLERVHNYSISAGLACVVLPGIATLYNPVSHIDLQCVPSYSFIHPSKKIVLMLIYLYLLCKRYTVH